LPKSSGEEGKGKIYYVGLERKSQFRLLNLPGTVPIQKDEQDG